MNRVLQLTDMAALTMREGFVVKALGWRGAVVAAAAVESAAELVLLAAAVSSAQGFLQLSGLKLAGAVALIAAAAGYAILFGLLYVAARPAVR